MNRSSYQSETYYQDNTLKRVNDAYSLCLLGLFCSYLTILVAIGVAIANLPRTRGTPLHSHLKYIISGCVYYTLALGISIGVIYWTYQQHFLDHGKLWTPLTLYLFFGLVPFIWWIARFIRGLKLLKKKQAIANPLTPWLGH